MIEITQTKKPSTYFDLITLVGNTGTYQTIVFLIFSLNWFIAGILLLGTSFLFMNPQFSCQGTTQQIRQCQKNICAQNPQLWGQYLRQPEVQSLATQFGLYLCDRKEQLNELRMILYIGTFIGYLVFLFITDNFGRKVSIIAAWSVTTFGVFLLCIASNMTMACVGLFLAGAGCESSIKISMAIFAEIVDYYKRQSYSVALQIAFGLSGVVVGIVYWIFREWRIINIVFCGIPCLIQLLLLIFYLQETPKFLLTKKGMQKSLCSLNRIGNINKNDKNLIERQHIEAVLEHQQGKQMGKFNFIITPLDLLKFRSLRKNTICCSLVFMLMTYLYFGPIVIVDKLALNAFASQIIMSFSELLAYPFSFWFIQKLPRIRSGYICLGLAIVFNGVLIIVRPGQDCNGCIQGTIEVIFVFCSRFVVSLYLSIFFLYITEIFPLTARGLGFGVVSASGAIASSSGQYIFTQLEDKKINPMILFTIFSCLCLFVLLFMQDTLNQPLKDQIDEIKQLKNEQKHHKNMCINESQCCMEINGGQNVKQGQIQYFNKIESERQYLSNNP